MDDCLILLPGLLCDARLWRHPSECLASRCRVEVPDLTQDESLAAMAERILATAPPRFALGGLSMGGYLCFEILRRAPERVSRLALVCTNAHADAPEQQVRRRDAIALVRSGRFDLVVAAQAAVLLSPEAAADPERLGLFRAMAAAIGPEAFIRQQTAIMARPDSRPGLAAIACPTLVLCGELDGLTPPALHRDIAAAIPGARLVEIAGSGHLAPLERPEAVTAALTAWLDGWGANS